jgi:hypothetical protein
VFDSERLKPIIAALGDKLAPIAKESRLQEIRHTMTLVDGTVITALPRIAQASFLVEFPFVPPSRQPSPLPG